MARTNFLQIYLFLGIILGGKSWIILDSSMLSESKSLSRFENHRGGLMELQTSTAIGRDE